MTGDLGSSLRADLVGSRLRTRTIAWLLGLTTESLYWSSVLAGGAAALLAALIGAHATLFGQAVDGWLVSILAAYSTGMTLIIKQANLRARVALFFDYTSRCECLRMELDNPPSPHTMASVNAICLKFIRARNGLQRALYEIDTGQKAPSLGEEPEPSEPAGHTPTGERTTTRNRKGDLTPKSALTPPAG